MNNNTHEITTARALRVKLSKTFTRLPNRRLPTQLN
jgi:hypothetical protein